MNGRPWRPTRVLAEEDRRAVADEEGDRGADEERAEEDQADGGPDDVHEALQEQADLALAVVDERADEEPVELLLHRAGKDLLDRVDRDADRLPLAGRQAGDRLQVAGRLRRQADRDLVDDLRVEDLLDVADRAEDRAGDDGLVLAGDA